MLLKNNKNLRGVMYMALAMFVFAFVDALAKYLTQVLPALQIAWLRWAAMFVGVLLLLIKRGPNVLKTNNLKLQILRGTTAGLSALIFIYGLSYVPLADAVAMTFVAPILVTVMAAFFLGEKVGITSIIAVFFGFLGVLLVLKPGVDGFQPWLILPLIAAALFALRQVISRLLGFEDSLETTTFYTAVVAFLVSSTTVPFAWEPISLSFLIFTMAAMSLLAALGEFFVIRSLNVAQAAAVAPVHYSLVVWSTLYGYLLFGHVPDFFTCLGGFTIMLSGLYILYISDI